MNWRSRYSRSQPAGSNWVLQNLPLSTSFREDEGPEVGRSPWWLWRDSLLRFYLQTFWYESCKFCEHRLIFLSGPVLRSAMLHSMAYDVIWWANTLPETLSLDQKKVARWHAASEPDGLHDVAHRLIGKMEANVWCHRFSFTCSALLASRGWG